MKKAITRLVLVFLGTSIGCGSSDTATSGGKLGVGAPTAASNPIAPGNMPRAMAGLAGTTSSVPMSSGTAMTLAQMMTPAGMAPGAAGTGAAPTTGMMPASTAPMPVLVDPADVAACDATGAPPDASETVEVIKVRTSDVVPGGYAAPGGTVYACFWVDIDMPVKHHIIGWEGAVGDRAVHHQQVSLSAKPFYLAQQGGLCGLPTVDFTWTGEKPTEWTPKLAGYPLGGPDSGGKAHFLWQVHFESATMYTGGFNVYTTTNLRKYDAGNLEQGDVSGINIPAMASATHVATCTPDMTQMKLIQPIYFFAAMQHAHLTVTHIKSTMSRGGMLVKTFGDQQVAGFAGFFDQQFNPVNPCLEVMPGDQLETTCDYTNNTPNAIVGGEGLNNEMCTTFFQYFPRLPGASNNFCGTIDSSGGFLGM